MSVPLVGRLGSLFSSEARVAVIGSNDQGFGAPVCESRPMSQLTTLSAEEWVAWPDPWCIAILDCTTGQATASFGWTWDEVEEEGIGVVFYRPLAWAGSSRFLLSSSGVYPDDGIAIEVSAAEDAAGARRDFLSGLGLTAEVFLAVSEDGVWFSRDDEPAAGRRPGVATHRPFGELPRSDP